MQKTITISKRFAGPPEMGNGGYVAGLLAQQFTHTAVTVRLHRPVPLERPLTLKHNTGWQLMDGNTRLATAKAAALSLPLPAIPTFAEVESAPASYSDETQHPFPHCFVCGPARHADDGLCIFPKPVPNRDLVGAIWQPSQNLAGGDGWVQSQFLWAALDCPGGIAAIVGKLRPMVLGKITGELQDRLRPTERVLVLGWHFETNGRKHHVGTALIAESGKVIGKAEALWIELK